MITYGLHVVFIWFTYSLHLVYIWFIRGYIWFTHGLTMVYIWFTYGLHMVYIWFTHSLHTVYLWLVYGIHILQILPAFFMWKIFSHIIILHSISKLIVMRGLNRNNIIINRYKETNYLFYTSYIYVLKYLNTSLEC